MPAALLYPGRGTPNPDFLCKQASASLAAAPLY